MTTPSPRSPRRKHKISKSDGTSLPVVTGDDVEDVGYAPDDEGADLPPGRMHVVNQQMLRLQGKGATGHHQHTTSSGSLSSLEGAGGSNRSPIIMNSAIGPAGGSTGAICPPSPRSTRSRSPLTQPRGTGPERNNDIMSASVGKQGTGTLSEKNATNSTFDGNSSISSLDDIVDQDILYDRAGLIDDLSQSSSTNAGKNRLHNSREGFTNLTPVTERLSEETLEDVHAFSDLNPPVVGISISCRSQTSRANSSQATSTDRDGVLAALDECAEEDEESLEDPSETEQAQQEVILLTNMEKVDINSRSEDDGDGIGGLEPASLAGTDVGVSGGGMGTAPAESGTDDAAPLPES